jgi:hypothetical protein
VNEYESRWSRHWTIEYMAIARFYAAREKGLAKRDAEAAEIYRKAYELNPFDRIADQIQKLAGRRPEKPAGFLGHRLPVDYDLPRVDGAGRASLVPALAALAPGQLFLLVALATYRGNGPYNDLMLRWASYSSHFKEYLPSCHVVTEKPQEDAVKQRGLPHTLLFDRDGMVSRALQPAGSPWVWLVDRERIVRYDGELDDVGIWDALAV